MRGFIIEISRQLVLERCSVQLHETLNCMAVPKHFFNVGLKSVMMSGLSPVSLAAQPDSNSEFPEQFPGVGRPFYGSCLPGQQASTSAPGNKTSMFRRQVSEDTLIASFSVVNSPDSSTYRYVISFSKHLHAEFLKSLLTEIIKKLHRGRIKISSSSLGTCAKNIKRYFWKTC